MLYVIGIEPIDAKDLSYTRLEKRLKNIEIAELRSLLKDMLSPYPWQRPSIEEVEKRLLYVWKKYIVGLYGQEVKHI